MTLKVSITGPIEDEKHGTICTVDVYSPDQDPKHTWNGESWMIPTDDPVKALKTFASNWPPKHE